MFADYENLKKEKWCLYLIFNFYFALTILDKDDVVAPKQEEFHTFLILPYILPDISIRIIGNNEDVVRCSHSSLYFL